MAKLPDRFNGVSETYDVLEVLGEGGSGRVLKVANAEKEKFALKCLLPERVNTERRKRFTNEIRFCERSDHSNVVKVIDSGVADVEGTVCPFYVMPFYPATLAKLMENGIKSAEVLSLYAQLLDGVEAAHLQKVWHRDLKPENVLFDGNRLVVADFGIARFTDFEHATAVKTRHASKLANLAYSAPEQRQKGREVDQRADIWALGLILNEMFTGQLIQGAGYKVIASVAPELAYLDELVLSMVQNDAGARIASIADVKRQLIARGKEFVVQQELNAKSKQVVPKYAPGEVRPVEMVGYDYNGSTLFLDLDRMPEPGWVQHFNYPRGNFRHMMGYGPLQYQFRGNRATIGNVDSAKTAQTVIDQFAMFAEMATRSYKEELKQQAARQEIDDKRRLQAEVAELERRKSVLQSIKLK